jgi:hypothetical protein
MNNEANTICGWPYPEPKSMSNQSENINELAAALAKAQGEIVGALKDSKNPFFKSNYADLASCWDACRAQLSKNALAVIQTTRCHDGQVYVVTTLTHSSGQWIRGELPVKAKDDGPQAQGSGITYARRYALAAIVGLAQIDDDAEAAQGRVSDTQHAINQLKGQALTPQKRDTYLPEIAKFIDAEDGLGMRQLWDELSQHEQADLWRLLSTKQKTAARGLLQKKAAA